MEDPWWVVVYAIVGVLLVVAGAFFLRLWTLSRRNRNAAKGLAFKFLPVIRSHLCDNDRNLNQSLFIEPSAFLKEEEKRWYRANKYGPRFRVTLSNEELKEEAKGVLYRLVADFTPSDVPFRISFP